MATEVLPPLPKGATTLPPLPSGALNIDSLDKDTGASVSLRSTVSAYKKPEDKLKLIKKYYPDAIPFGSDNYVFKNPKTNRPTLFNPEGLDFGDFAEYGRIGANILGGLAGFTTSAVVASPTIVGVPVAGAVGGAAGSLAAGEAYDAALRSIFGEGVEDTRTASEYATDLAIEGTIEAVTPFPAAAGIKYGRKGLDKVFNTPETKNIINSAKNLGINELPLGVSSSGGNMARFEKGLATTAGGGKIVNLYADGINQLSKSVDEITSMGANQSKESAGEIIKNAAIRFEDDFMARSDALYSKVDSLINPNEIFLMPNVARVLKSSEYKFNNKNLSKVFGKEFSDDLKNVFKVKNKEGKLVDGPVELSYKDIAALRTQIGKQLKGGNFVIGVSPDKGGLKELYGALTDDMFNAAKLVGGDAEKFAIQANDYYRQGSTILEKQIRPLVTTRGGKDFLSSEKIYDKFDKGTLNEPSRFNKITNNLFNKGLKNEDQLTILGEKQLYDLTRDPAGDLSIGKTVSNLTKYTKGTGELPNTIQSIGTKVDDIKEVSKAFREADKFTNFSNTATGNAQRELYASLGLGIGGGLYSGDVSTGLSIAAGSYLAPKVIASLLENRVTRKAIYDFARNADVPVDAKKSILIGIGFGSSQADSVIQDAYKKPEGLLE
tara:strand:+ start:790 stop:2778 length:1989 start_codon:yes stop_codon:yes gene_type:complete